MSNQQIKQFSKGAFALFVTGLLTAEVTSAFCAASRFWLWVVVVNYFAIQTGLLLALASKLVAHNDMQSWNFSIGALLIGTTIIALPLGMHSIFIRTVEATALRSNYRTVLSPTASIAILFAFYFAIVPLLLQTEAVIKWLVERNSTRNQLRRRRN